jgi:hypothetical protein
MGLSALALAVALGHAPTREVRQIASALDRACHGDVQCLYDGAEYAERESSWLANPRPQSWDARAGLARGPWQLWNAPVRLEDQAVRWCSLRAASLAQFGDLRGLPGATPAGVRIARSRAYEANLLRYAVEWAELP